MPPKRRPPESIVILPPTSQAGDPLHADVRLAIGTRSRRRSATRRRRTVAVITALAVVATASIGWTIAHRGQHLWPLFGVSANKSSPATVQTVQPSEPQAVAVSNESTLSVAPVTPSISVNAVGDIAFVTSVEQAMASSGAEAPVAGVADVTANADLTIANLETALSARGAAVPGKTFTFRSKPDRSIAALKRAGIDVVSLANNHTRDWGGDALVDTLNSLSAAGIRYAGAGNNRAEAFAPAIIESRGATIAYLAFSQIGPSNFVATDAVSGTAFTVDMGTVTSAITRASEQADYVIVSFHWGVEKSYSPSERQVSFGRAAIDAGADCVLAHHPHVLQGVEFYNGKMIAYSLGNFVFSPGSSAGRDTMILSFTLAPDGVKQATATPAYIKTNGTTVLASGESASRIRNLIAETSSGRNTAATPSADGQSVLLTAP